MPRVCEGGWQRCQEVPRLQLRLPDQIEEDGRGACCRPTARASADASPLRCTGVGIACVHAGWRWRRARRLHAGGEKARAAGDGADAVLQRVGRRLVPVVAVQPAMVVLNPIL